MSPILATLSPDKQVLEKWRDDKAEITRDNYRTTIFQMFNAFKHNLLNRVPFTNERIWILLAQA